MLFETHKRLKREHRQQLFELWNSEFPVSLVHKQAEDFDNYLYKLVNPEHYLLSQNNKTIAGWAYSFERQDETWFGLLVNPLFQRKGYGSRLLDILKQKHSKLNGWVIDHRADVKQNGKNYLPPLDFYLKNKFSPVPDCRLENELLSAVKIHWEK